MKWVLKDFDLTESTPVEFKQTILDYHPVAAYWYARAYRCKHVTGPPIALLRVKLPLDAQVNGLLHKTLKTKLNQHTLAFCQPLTKKNYPGLTDYEVEYIQKDVALEILELGRNLLNETIIIQEVNDTNKRTKS